MDPEKIEHARPEVPILVGRMILLSRIGAGRMGVVYAAYDPELDRKVAVKMIRPDRTASQGARARMLHEAQALARLSHPNVVGIHDVGTLDEHVWLAMEFVQGATVSAWLAERPRSWQEILSVFRQAAHGIEAAHRAGLLHRDLKPANIMVSNDGRVRVMDFGLACEAPDAERTDYDSPAPRAMTHTRTGVRAGTPAYMAPEESLGFVGDARTDQFSFCVALWEALFSEHPFADESFASRTPRVMAGDRRSSTTAHRVPGWLRRSVERGLASNLEARYPNMHELRAALDADPTRRRWATGLVLVVALVAAGFVGLRYVERERALAACDVAGSAIDEVWNDGARARLHDGLGRTQIDDATAVAERVIPVLDRHASEWRDARIELCRTATVDVELPPAMAESAAQCLEERRVYLQSLVDVLSDAAEGPAPRGLVHEAIPAVGTLVPAHTCRDHKWLQIRPPLPDDAYERDEVLRVRSLLAKASALQVAGLYDRSLALAEEAKTAAAALGWPPLLAAADLQRGEALSELDQIDQAETALESAYFRAWPVGEDEVALAAAGKLAYVLAEQRKLPNEGLRWARSARLILERAGAKPDDLRWILVYSRLALVHDKSHEYGPALDDYGNALRVARATFGDEHPRVARILHNMGSIHREQRQHNLADDAYRQALAIRERILPPSHPDLAVSFNSLGHLRAIQDDPKRAIEYFMRAREIWTNALGADSTRVAQTLNNLGVAHGKLGDLATAIRYFEETIAVYERLQGNNSSNILAPLVNLGARYRELGDLERAAAYLERAIDIKTQKRGKDDPELASILINLGAVYNDQTRHDDAIQAQERARKILEATVGANDARIAIVFNNLGMSHLDQHAYVTAIADYEHALAIAEKTLGPDHPDTAISLTGLAMAHLENGHAELAEPAIRRAIALREKAAEEPTRLAWARFVLARIRWSELGGQDDARQIAREAADAYRQSGTFDSELAEIEAWRADRPAPATSTRRPRLAR